MEISQRALFFVLTLALLVLMATLWMPQTTIQYPAYLKHYFTKKTPCNNSIDFTGTAPFADVFLAINFNHPFYQNIPVLKRYYEPIFPNYLFCGPEVDAKGGHPIVVIPQPRNQYGFYGYQCLTEAVRRNPGYKGYFYVNDDMIINWWNFHKLDKNKIWFPMVKRMGAHPMLPNNIPVPFWWLRAAALERCSKTFAAIESDPKMLETNAIRTYLENVGNKRVCSNALSDIVYVPGRFAKTYELLTQKFFDNLVFLEVSTPMVISMLDKRENMIDIEGLYLQVIFGWGPWTRNTDRAWLKYDYKTFFLHPYKFSGENQTKNSGEFESRVIAPSEIILREKCLDILTRGRFWV